MEIKHIKYWISSITLILIANLVLMWLLKLQTIENNLTLILGLTAIIAASVVTLKVAPIAQIGGAPGDKDAYQLKENELRPLNWREPYNCKIGLLSNAMVNNFFSNSSGL